MHLGNWRIIPHKYMDSCFRIRPSSAKRALEFNAKCLLSRFYRCQTQLWHFVEISLERKISHLIRRPCVCCLLSQALPRRIGKQQGQAEQLGTSPRRRGVGKMFENAFNCTWSVTVARGGMLCQREKMVFSPRTSGFKKAHSKLDVFGLRN